MHVHVHVHVHVHAHVHVHVHVHVHLELSRLEGAALVDVDLIEPLVDGRVLDRKPQVLPHVYVYV